MVQLHQFLGAGDKQDDGMVGDFLEAEVGNVDDQDLVVGSGIHIDVVITDTATDNGAQLGQVLKNAACEWRPDDKDDIGILGLRDDLILGGGIDVHQLDTGLFDHLGFVRQGCSNRRPFNPCNYRPAFFQCYPPCCLFF